MRKFYIVHNSIEREVYPLNSFKLKLISELEKDQIFKRTKLNGTLQFGNDLKTSITDFDFFSNLEFNGSSCDEITIIIRKKCFGAWIDEWTGFFSTGGGSFDLDRCLFEVQADPDDVYRCVFKNWETEFDIFDYDVEEVLPTAGTLEECNKVLVCHCSINPLLDCCDLYNYFVPCAGYANAADMYADGWCVKEHIVDESGVDPVLHTYWCRETLVVPCSGIDCGAAPDATWTPFIDNCAGDGTCTYVRCCSGTVAEDNLRGVLWKNTIEGSALSICDDLQVITSIFFDLNPDVTDPVYVAGINYITGLTSKVDNLIVSQKSDIIDPGATNPATIGVFTLKLWLDWCREVFNCYWKIEEVAGVLTFKIEHYDYFQNTLAVDLTSATYADLVRYSNKYDHLKGEIPRKEIWQWMDKEILQATLFDGYPIIYSELCSQEGSELNHELELLTTNITMLLDNPQASLDGFCLISTSVYLGDYILNYETVLGNPTLYANAHLALPNLHENYHKYNRFLGEGNMNGALTTFLSWKPNIKQIAVKIPDCCPGIDVEGYVITELGITLGANGIINRADLDLNNEYLTLLIAYSI